MGREHIEISGEDIGSLMDVDIGTEVILEALILGFQ